MLTVSTPKVHLTVVANQGTWEMATTVQVGPAKSFFYFLWSIKNFLMPPPPLPPPSLPKKDTDKLSRHPGFLCVLKPLWIEQHSSDRTVYFFNWQKRERERDPEQIFQFLESGLKGGKMLKSFSVTQQTSYTTNSSCTILLWMELLRFIISLVMDLCRSSSWRVWMKKPHQFI